MKDDIVRKIKAEVKRGITTESQAVYLMVEVRKLLDKDRMKRDPNSAEPFPVIRHYSDWTVHVSLSFPRAQTIVKLADKLYPNLASGTMTDEEKAEFSEVFSLDRLREEMTTFMQIKLIPPFSTEGWNTFLACFLNVIEDCPLVCKGDGATVKYVDEVFIVQDSARVPDGSPLPVIWALCFKGKFKQSIGGDPSMDDRIFEAIEAFIEARDE